MHDNGGGILDSRLTLASEPVHPAVVISVVGVSNVAVHKRKLFCFVRLCGLESVLCILVAQNSPTNDPQAYVNLPIFDLSFFFLG